MREKAEKPAKRKLTRAERKQIEAVIRQAKGEPEPGGGRQEEHYLIPGSGFRLLVSELHMFLVTWYSIAKCLSQAQNEKDFLRLQKKYGNYEKTLNRLRRKLGLSADSNFCQDELEAAVIKRFRAELIPGEQISHE